MSQSPENFQRLTIDERKERMQRTAAMMDRVASKQAKIERLSSGRIRVSSFAGRDEIETVSRIRQAKDRLRPEHYEEFVLLHARKQFLMVLSILRTAPLKEVPNGVGLTLNDSILTFLLKVYFSTDHVLCHIAGDALIKVIERAKLPSSVYEAFIEEAKGYDLKELVRVMSR